MTVKNPISISNPDIAAEWNYQKNKGLTPNDVTAGSGKKVWWILPYDDPNSGKRFDFEWQATICNRTSKNSGCPYLSGACYTGFNDLQTLRPDLAAEWDRIRNQPITPQNVSCGTHKKFFWVCSEGHSYKMSVDKRVHGRKCPICSNQIVVQGINDLATTNPDLLKEWCYDKNVDILPTNIVAGSGKRVWWRCPNGHEWQTTVQHRSSGSGCPICSQPQNSENRSKSVRRRFPNPFITHPELIEQLDNDKNEYSSLTSVALSMLLWWKCPNGHSYSISVAQRIKDTGCPYCSNRKVLKGYNDLATTNPDLVQEWNYEKNASLLPDEVTPSSSKKVWWKCRNGHEWTTTVNYRAVRGYGCPVCSGKQYANRTSLKDWSIDNDATYLLEEWDDTKNSYDVSKFGYGSDKKVWWKCRNGHEWQARIDSRTGKNRSMCPFCYGKKEESLAITHPNVAKYWHPNKNGDLTPDQVTSGSNQVVWWIAKDGTEFQAKIVDRIGYRKTKPDKTSKISYNETAIYMYVKKFYPDAIQSYKFKDSNYLELDIFVPSLNIGIEYDGYYAHHDKLNRDLKKYKICNSKGIRLIRIREPRLPTIDNPSYTHYSLADYSISSFETIIKELLLHEFAISHPDINIKRDNITILEAMDRVEADHSFAEVFPEIAKQWHPTKNGLLTPDMFSFASNKEVWWLLPYDDPNTGKHFDFEWKASINKRASGHGCPYLVGKQIYKGFNDFATTNPDLAKEWNYEKNGELKPDMVMAGSLQKVWWILPYDDPITGKHFDFEWEASLNNRTRGRLCPYISNRKLLIGYNDFETTCKALGLQRLLVEWDKNMNETLPTNITRGHQSKVWWKCKYCGYEWQSTPEYRLKHCKYPSCHQ